MKKNLMALMFVASFLCFGTFTASAKTPISLSKADSKISRQAVQASLKEINLSVKRAKGMCNSLTADCWEMLSTLMLLANIATDICGGPDGSNYDSSACQAALWVANAYGDYFIASGCGDLLPSGNVSSINPKKKYWITRRKVVGIG